MIVLLPLEGVVGGIGFLIAIGGYLLLDATKAHMLREGVVFTLAIIYALSIIMLLFKSISEIIENKGKDCKMAWGILIIQILAIILGLIFPMQKSIFHYYYISRWLGTLQVAGLVSLITNFIYSIGDEFGGLGFMIGQVIFAIIIGQAIITVLSFTWGFPNIEAFFNTKMYYYNEKYDLNRDKFKTPLEMANLALTDFIEDLSKDNDKKVDGEYIKKSLDKSSNFRKNYLGDYGFDCISCNEMKNGNLDYLIYDKAYYNHTDEYKYNLEFDVSTCRFKEFVKKEK